MRLTLHVWRQTGPKDKGGFKTYQLDDVNTHMSFLEMLDVLNQELIEKGEEPVAFEHDCREGICGCCGMVINGVPHGGQQGTTVCQLHMRMFSDGEELFIEPWRAKGFPVIRDLVVDRSAFDRVVQAGAYISVNTGAAPDANAIPVPKDDAEMAFDAAACIGCGACVAACKNASAMLFVGAKISSTSTCRRVRSSATAAPGISSRRWTPRASATAPTRTSARPCAPRRSRCGSSPR